MGRHRAWVLDLDHDSWAEIHRGARVRRDHIAGMPTWETSARECEQVLHASYACKGSQSGSKARRATALPCWPSWSSW